MTNLVAYACFLTTAFVEPRAATQERYLIYGVTLLVALLFIWRQLRFSLGTARANTQNMIEAKELGIDRPPAQHPQVDVTRCIGCGACVAACPEGEVLGLVAGKAVIINGLRCVGHGKCAEACPVEALGIGLGDPESRKDLPRLDQDLQCSVPGIYICGELGGLALIKNAIQQGTAAARAISRELKPGRGEDLLDVLIVGAGPAGLTAAIVVRQCGFSLMVLDRQGAGGTILQYPRRKMVLTQPVEIPGYGKLNKPEYSKEALLEIWEALEARHQLPVRAGEEVTAIKGSIGEFEVQTKQSRYRARRVILALGRRGVPRKLNVPGEHLAKVNYQLLEPEQYAGEPVMVVGGGDSAVEAAMALSLQEGTQVVLSYRKHKFFRIKKRNRERLQSLLEEERIKVFYQSELVEIAPDHVVLEVEGRPHRIANNFVFIFAGGVPPYGLLRQAGVSFYGET